MLHDPFDRARLPPDFDRQARVRLLAEATHDLLAGRLPAAPARLFLAGGLSSWLREGGSLEADFWKVKAPRGSHATPARILIAMSDTGGSTRHDGLSSTPSGSSPCTTSTTEAPPPADT